MISPKLPTCMQPLSLLTLRRHYLPSLNDINPVDIITGIQYECPKTFGVGTSGEEVCLDLYKYGLKVTS